MKKRAMTLGLALFCAFLLCGCQRTAPAAPAQEAAPEPEAAEEKVLLLGEHVPAEPEPEPEPEPFAATLRGQFLCHPSGLADLADLRDLVDLCRPSVLVGLCHL